MVGAGPVGLCVALALLKAGLPVSVVEQRTAIPQDPRATTIQPPVLERFARWGVLQAVLAAGVKVERLQYWDWLGGPAILADLDYRHLAGDTPCPYRIHLDQHGLSEILVRAIEALHPGTVTWGHKVLSVDDRGDHVVATVLDRNERMYAYRASTVVAADGHGSSIREALGVKVHASGPTTGFLSAFAPPNVFDQYKIADAAYLYDDDGWALVMRLADRVRLLCPVPTGPAEAMGAPAMDALARRWIGGGAEGVLHSLGMYRVRPGVADRLRVGRVVLAGDSAHAAYPVGGTAMNCGILDADALANALVVGTDEALDAYAQARRAWATERVVNLAAASLRAMSATGLWNRTTRRAHLWAIASTAERTRAHLKALSLMG